MGFDFDASLEAAAILMEDIIKVARRLNRTYYQHYEEEEQTQAELVLIQCLTKSILIEQLNCRLESIESELDNIANNILTA